MKLAKKKEITDPDFGKSAAHKIKELEQEEDISESIKRSYKKKFIATRTRLIILSISVVVVIGFFTLFSIFVGEQTIDESKAFLEDSSTSQFLIQNLRGDTIDTWINWKIVQGHTLHVHVVDSKYVTQERLEAIIETIMSTEEIEIDDSLLYKGPEGSTSTYYVGWFGALNSIDDNTIFPIPKNLHFHVTDKGIGDILIKLSNLSNIDGYSGVTLAIVDEAQHQILKSTITIYNIENQSIEQLKKIIRHELGHGFGLGHSTAPEDLMAPFITTDYPYISDCDLDAITLLYDGGKSSQVICEK